MLTSIGKLSRAQFRTPSLSVSVSVSVSFVGYEGMKEETMARPSFEAFFCFLFSLRVAAGWCSQVFTSGF